MAAVIENMAEFRPGLCTEAAQQGLMQWLLKRIKVRQPSVTGNITANGTQQPIRAVKLHSLMDPVVFMNVVCS